MPPNASSAEVFAIGPAPRRRPSCAGFTRVRRRMRTRCWRMSLARGTARRRTAARPCAADRLTGSTRRGGSRAPRRACERRRDRSQPDPLDDERHVEQLCAIGDGAELFVDGDRQVRRWLRDRWSSGSHQYAVPRIEGNAVMVERRGPVVGENRRNGAQVSSRCRTEDHGVGIDRHDLEARKQRNGTELVLNDLTGKWVQRRVVEPGGQASFGVVASGGCVVGCCSGSDEGVDESDGGSEDSSGGSMVWGGELGGQSAGMVDVVVAGLDVVDAGVDPDPGDGLDPEPGPVELSMRSERRARLTPSAGARSAPSIRHGRQRRSEGHGRRRRSGTVGSGTVGSAGSAGIVGVVGRTIPPPLPRSSHSTFCREAGEVGDLQRMRERGAPDCHRQR